MIKWLKILFIGLGVIFLIVLISEYFANNLMASNSIVRTRIITKFPITEETVDNLIEILEHADEYNSNLDQYDCQKQNVNVNCTNPRRYKVLTTGEYIDIVAPQMFSIIHARSYIPLDQISISLIITSEIGENIKSISTYYSAMQFERPPG